MVTENGGPDNVAEDGSPIDNIRADFLRRYFGSMKRALEENYPVIGYQLWSLMDNFEWAMGYGPRLGIVHIDYETQKRTVKESGRYYAQVIACNGENI
jgi:beta-glucosidase